MELNYPDYPLMNLIYKEESSLSPYFTQLKPKIPSEDQSRISFSFLLSSVFNELKDSMSSTLLSTEKELNLLFNNYSTEIQKSIQAKEAQMLNLPGLNSKITSNSPLEQNEILPLYLYAEKHIFSKVNAIIQLNASIQTTIQKNIQLMKLHLENKELINEEKPLEAFVIKQISPIVSSWFLTSIDFDEINLSNLLIENEMVYDFCKNYLFKKKEKNYTSIDYNKLKIQSEAHYSFIQNSIDHLNKIKAYRVNNEEMHRFFLQDKDSKILNTSSLSSIKLFDSNFRDQLWKPINIEGIAIPLHSLHIKKTLFHNNLLSTLALFPQLKRLSLKKCHLNDLSFNLLIDIFRSNDRLVSSLERLSLAGNHLTNIPNLFIPVQFSKKKYFTALKELNLEENNLYEMSKENFNFLPHIKILNLCNNNIGLFNLLDVLIEKNKNKDKNEKCLLLLAGNICLVNNKAHNEDYLNYLCKTLSSFDYPLKKLSMAYLFNSYPKEKEKDKLNICLCPYTNLHLRRLNLSNCSLKSKTVLSFIRNNGGLINLTHLVLNNNNIRLDFFEQYNNEVNKPEKLKKIDLSYNNLLIENFEVLRSLVRFCENNPYLKVIKIQNTPLELVLSGKFEKRAIEKLANDILDISIIDLLKQSNKFEIQLKYCSASIDEASKKLFRYKNKKI